MKFLPFDLYRPEISRGLNWHIRLYRSKSISVIGGIRPDDSCDTGQFQQHEHRCRTPRTSGSTGLTHAKLVSLTSPCCSGWPAPMNTPQGQQRELSSDVCADFNAWLESDLVLIINFNSTIRLEGPEDPHLRSSRLWGHVTSLTLQHLWPRPGAGCKPGHNGWS